MADDRDDSQRTEEPTQRRLEQAQEHGDIVESTEVTALAVLVGATLAIAIFGRSTDEGFVRTFRFLLEQPDQIAVDSTGVMSLLHGTLWSVVGLLVPVLVVLICSGLAGHLLQHRPVFSVERLKPDLSKRSLLKGFKRMFGLDGLSNLAKGVLKLLIIGAVAWTTLWPVRGALQTALNAGVHGV